MLAMYLKGDWSGQNGCLLARHACAIWRVVGLPSMAHGMADLPPSTPHACSTWWPCAGQLIDAGRGSASWSEKKEEVAHRRRRAGAQCLRTYLQHMDCQRPLCGPLAVHRLAGLTIQRSHSSHARRWPHQPKMARAGTGERAGSWAAMTKQYKGALLRLLRVCRKQRGASDGPKDSRL
jgi:hypothetical protein